MSKKKPTSDTPTTDQHIANAMGAPRSKRAPSKFVLQKEGDVGDWQDLGEFASIPDADVAAAIVGKFRIVTVRKSFHVAKTETLAKTYE